MKGTGIFSTVVSHASDYHYTNGAEFSITIVNKSGTVLPTTGGIGATIFCVAGIVMVLGAVAVIFARRKAEQE